MADTPKSKADARGTLYVDRDGNEKYFTAETVKVAGKQGMAGWTVKAEKPQPLKD